MDMFSVTVEDLESNADGVKVAVLAALVDEGLLTEPVADEWCREHTTIVRKQGFLFKTFKKLFSETDIAKDTLRVRVVRKVGK